MILQCICETEAELKPRVRVSEVREGIVVVLSAVGGGGGRRRASQLITSAWPAQNHAGRAEG